MKMVQAVPSSYRYNRKAFTLIEVMVASILISLVGLSLIQMHQNSADMSYNMQGKFRHSDWPLMSAFEHKLEKAKKNTGFDTLMKPFNIDKQEVRKGLNHKVSISANLVERINVADITNELENENGEAIASFDGFNLEVYQQHTQMGDKTYSVYRVVKP